MRRPHRSSRPNYISNKLPPASPNIKTTTTTMTTPTPAATHLLKQSVKLALVQLACTADKAANLRHARTKVLEATKQGAKIVVLPECFNSPYGTKYFPQYAEQLQGVTRGSPPTQEQSPTFHALSSLAKESGAYIIGGSIPELVPGKESSSTTTTSTPENSSKDSSESSKPKYYNTNMTFSPTGQLIATHRKVHLFDISIPNKITFRESDVLSPGSKITLVDLPEYGRIAIAICYDIRFPELATIAARRGAFLLVYPGAFNLTTGALHWELQARARAVDNQVFVALCSPSRDMDAEYNAWGHSCVVDPNAEVLGMLDEKEGVLIRELEVGRIEEVRKGIPVYSQRRFDVYPDVAEGGKFEE
ncbi:carbon-nitrogen hydrolase [Periconia macrospinosa]|uniref:Carbon-nitrogen hydrolase n=1 Tax=Periconia macrospinosa TaxID=97972 RepID=A0A2V1D7P9_9PLEO|nr:carbon-nitrogen hydrolase [Periconia macrospinosa]